MGCIDSGGWPKLCSASSWRQPHSCVQSSQRCQLEPNHNMPRPQPPAQSALKNIPMVILWPTWYNIVAASYLVKVMFMVDWLIGTSCSQATGHRLLHRTSVPLPAAQSSSATSLPPQRIHPVEPILLDLSSPGRVSRPVPHQRKCLGQWDILGLGRRRCCRCHSLRVLFGGTYAP